MKNIIMSAIHASTESTAFDYETGDPLRTTPLSIPDIFTESITIYTARAWIQMRLHEKTGESVLYTLERQKIIAVIHT